MSGARIRGLGYLIDLSSSNEASICFSCAHAHAYTGPLSEHLLCMHRMNGCSVCMYFLSTCARREEKQPTGTLTKLHHFFMIKGENIDMLFKNQRNFV